MKQIKLVLLLVLLVFITTGCVRRDNLDGIEIAVTAYPYEYITRILYGNHSLVSSIFPDGVNIWEHQLSERTLNDYSRKNIFIYSSINNDKDIAIKLLERNRNMLIIDATFGMAVVGGNEELWLNPSNLLMIAQNIRNGLLEYINSNYLRREIEEKYEELRIVLSELDAEIKLTAENAARKTIVTNTNSLLFLEKYGFEVISLDARNNISDRIIAEVKNRIDSSEIKHLFVLENTERSDGFNQIVNDTEIVVLTLKSISNITDKERDEKKDYLSLMSFNLELLKSELY